MTDIRICIPWGFDFEHAKSGLRDLRLKGEARGKDIYSFEGYTFDVEPRQGSPNVQRTRNSLLTDFNKPGGNKNLLNYDYFFFVDSDIVWKMDYLIKLLQHEVDVCCAPYIMRGGSFYDCGLWKDKPGPVLKRFETSETGFKPIHFTGAGFLLIARSALERLEYPYFRYVDFIDSDGMLEQMGHDWGFCAQCKEKGIRIWCDFDINIAHKPKNPSAGDWLY